MVRRAKSFDELASKTLLKSRKARQEYVLEMVEEENYSVEDALKDAISKMGQAEFAELSGIVRQTVNQFVSGKRKVSAELLNDFLKPFGLKIKIGVEKLRAA